MMKMVQLKDLVPAAANTVNTQFIVLEKEASGGTTAAHLPTTPQDAKQQRDQMSATCLALVADETASVHFQMWGSECEAFEPGDIVRLTSGIFSYHKNTLLLRAGKRGKAEKVGHFTMLFVETPNMSEIRWACDPADSKKFVKESVISLYSTVFPPNLPLQ